MPKVVHINDNALLVQETSDNGGQIIQRSQGYAWLQDGHVVYDVSADIDSAQHPIKHCRLEPQTINSRYWQQCAQTAIANNGAGMRHAADLMWKHVAELKRQSALADIAVVVPADYRDAQLKLLLGVIKANDLSVSALISKPVLAVQQRAVTQGHMVHIDVQLHQTVISTVSVSEQEVTLVDVEVKADIGLQALQEALLHHLQASFIRNDRFDPLHNAATEQQLFDQLSDIVAKVDGTKKATVGVEHHSKLYSAVVEAGEVEAALSDLIGLINSHSGQHSGQVVVDLNGAFELAHLPSINPKVIWATQPEPITAKLANGTDSDAGVIHQVSLPAIQTAFSTNGAGRDAGNSSAINSAANKATAADASAAQVTPSITKTQASAQPLTAAQPSITTNKPSQVATHLMQFGVVVALDKAAISTDGAVLRLIQADAGQASDLPAMLNNGALSVINDSKRTHLLANDRLMSPAADGVITAVAVLV